MTTPFYVTLAWYDPSEGPYGSVVLAVKMNGETETQVVNVQSLDDISPEKRDEIYKSLAERIQKRAGDK